MIYAQVVLPKPTGGFGSKWGTDIRVTTDGGVSSYNPYIAVHPISEVIMVAIEDGDGIEIYRSSDGGYTWENSYLFADETDPYLVVDPDFFHLVSEHPNGTDIMVRRFNSYGNLVHTVQIYNSPISAFPSCATTGARLHIGYLVQTAQGWKPYVKVLDADDYSYLTQWNQYTYYYSSAGPHTYMCEGAGYIWFVIDASNQNGNSSFFVFRDYSPNGNNYQLVNEISDPEPNDILQAKGIAFEGNRGIIAWENNSSDELHFKYYNGTSWNSDYYYWPSGVIEEGKPFCDGNEKGLLCVIENPVNLGIYYWTGDDPTQGTWEITDIADHSFSISDPYAIFANGQAGVTKYVIYDNGDIWFDATYITNLEEKGISFGPSQNSSIYPTVTHSLSFLKENNNVPIYDSRGRRVKHLGKYQNGIYFISTKNFEGKESKSKIIIIK